MRLLVTGMTASQIHEDTPRMGLTLAGGIADILRMNGHRVDVRPFSLNETYGEYDYVWVGLGPLKGLGTSYAYGALWAIHEYLPRSRCGVYLDDTDSRKIGAEFKTIVRKPQDLVKPFFSYKKEWQRAREADRFGNLVTVAGFLCGRVEMPSLLELPPMFIPSWNYDLAFQSATYINLELTEKLFTGDPSTLYEVPLDKPKDIEEKYWATMWEPDSRQVARMGAHDWSVEKITRFSWEPLAGASGLLVPVAAWVPELHIAVKHGIPVACDWRTLAPVFGEPFEALAANIELMTDSERTDLAKMQGDALQIGKDSIKNLRTTFDSKMGIV